MRARVVSGVVLAVVLAALASWPGRSWAPPVSAAPSSHRSGPLLGITHTNTVGGTLSRIDPADLRPLAGPSVELEGHTFGWSFSPDGSRLVLGNGAAPDGPVELRFVDMEAMRTLGDVRVANGGSIRETRWVGPERVLAIVDRSSGDEVAVVVDATALHVVHETELAGSLIGVEATRDGFAVLMSAPNSIGPTRLVLVRADGSTASVPLARIEAGNRFSSRPVPVIRNSHPGLAVDAEAGHAYVFPGGNLVADVDLARLDVAYRAATRSLSFWDRLRSWLEPEAGAKYVAGPYRTAERLDSGSIVVGGSDSIVTGTTLKTMRQRQLPAGVRLVDPTSWRYRVLEPKAGFALVAGDRLLVMGTSFDSRTNGRRGIGLQAFSLDGHKLFTALSGKPVYTATAYGDRAYAVVAGQQRLRVIDLRTGSLLGTRAEELPLLLVGSRAPSWD
jgi:hypothetical protein